jgi:hypothetical protein
MANDVASSVWLTRAELAERWKIPRATLDQWGSRGLGPKYGVFGRHARYRLSDVIAWENAQFDEAQPQPAGVDQEAASA